MRLDRNIGRGKYALLKLRRLDELKNVHSPQGFAEIEHAIALLERVGVIDYGDRPETEFFVMRLRDKYAGSGLFGYANAAHIDDPEYSEDIDRLARRAGPASAFCKIPD